MLSGITADEVSVTADASGNLYLTDGYQGDLVKLDGEMLDSAHGVQTVQFADGTNWNRSQLITKETNGTTSTDTLYGTAGADTFDGKGAPAGSTDTEIGDGGSDTYIFNSGYGNLTIENESVTRTVPEGYLSLGLGLDQTNLWFVQSQNDLVVDVLGTQDSVTIKGWFGANASADVAEIIGGDGAVIDTEITQLTAAMATYQSNNPAFNPVSATAMPSDPVLQSALAGAWHH